MMSPTPPNPSDGRRSGNPAVQAAGASSAKQQRELQKQRKLAEYQAQLAKRRRGKVVWWTVGIAAGAVVVALIVASLVFTPRPVTLEPGTGDGSAIEGVQTFDNTSNHVQGTVDYPQSPPTGGDHNAYWLNCGVYTEVVPEENAVHSLEHGAVWIAYDADAVSQNELDAIKRKLPSGHVILSPYDGLDSPLVLSAWNAQLALDSADDERFEEFLTTYWRAITVPEPNALCTGAIDGPGKQS